MSHSIFYAAYLSTLCRGLMDLLPHRYPTSPALPPHILTRATHNILHAFSCDMPPMDLGSLRCPRLQRNRPVAKLVRKRALVIPIFVRGVIGGVLARGEQAFEGREAAYYHGLGGISIPNGGLVEDDLNLHTVDSIIPHNASSTESLVVVNAI